EVVNQALTNIGAHLTDVRNMLSVGLIPPSDVLTSEAQQAHEQQLLIEAQNAAVTAAADFSGLVGLALDTSIDLVEPLDRPAAPLEPLAGLLETARANSPERKALEARVGAAGERIVAAQAAKLPNIALDGGYDAARPNPKIFPRQAAWKPSFDIGASL